MEPTTAMAIAQGASSLLSAGSSIFGSKKSSKAAAQIAAMQLAWEREKAQNSIQWSVQDALKAGINPAVALNTNNNAGGINPPMPDTKGYNDAGTALGQGLANTAKTMLQSRQVTAQEQVAESETKKNESEAIVNGVRAGIMPKETAINEYNSATRRMEAQQNAQESIARINTMVSLLPGQTEAQKLDNASKAIQLSLDEANLPAGLTDAEINKRKNKIDNLVNKYTGGIFTASEIKNAIAGAVGFVGGKKMLSAGAKAHAKAQQRNHREVTYDRKGRITGEKYYEWAD